MSNRLVRWLSRRRRVPAPWHFQAVVLGRLAVGTSTSDNLLLATPNQALFRPIT